MKKTIATILLIMIVSVSLALATPGEFISGKIVGKDRRNNNITVGNFEGSSILRVHWVPIEDPLFGNISIKEDYWNDTLNVDAFNLTKKKKYVLAQGIDRKNVTCIANATADANGNLHIQMSGEGLWNDDFDQQFFLTKSSYVNCKKGWLSNANPKYRNFFDRLI